MVLAGCSGQLILASWLSGLLASWPERALCASQHRRKSVIPTDESRHPDGYQSRHPDESRDLSPQTPTFVGVTDMHIWPAGQLAG